MSKVRPTTVTDALFEAAVVGGIAVVLSMSGVQDMISNTLSGLVPMSLMPYMGQLGLFLSMATTSLVFNLYQMYRA